MFHTPEIVGYIPERGLAARDRGAFLDVLAVHTASVATTGICTDCCTSDSAAGGRDIVAASAADLVTEHAADDRAEDGAANVGIAAVFNDLLPLDPAALLGRTDY